MGSLGLQLAVLSGEAVEPWHGGMAARGESQVVGSGGGGGYTFESYALSPPHQSSLLPDPPGCEQV